MKKQINNILKVYKKASAEHVATGKNAYRDYNKFLTSLALHHDFTAENVIAAFAYLSPGVNIDKNFSATIALCEFVKADKDPSRLREIKYTGYSKMLNNAYEILTGSRDFKKELNPKTQKILCFYENIISPENKERVTIDRHMICIAAGGVVSAEDQRPIFDSRKKYRDLENIYLAAAKKLDIIPCELQAICWYSWRETKNAA